MLAYSKKINYHTLAGSCSFAFLLRQPAKYDKIKPEKDGKEIENMRKKTDLEAVKETLKLFLYMPIEETDLSPIIIQHPIFDTGYSSVDGKIVDITKPEGIQKATKKMEEKNRQHRYTDKMFVYYKKFVLSDIS